MTLAGIFKLYSKIFINVANKKPRGQPLNVLCGKSNYVVDEFSVGRQRAIISWDQVRRVVGIPCQFFIERTSDPMSRLETVQSHFQTESEN